MNNFKSRICLVSIYSEHHHLLKVTKRLGVLLHMVDTWKKTPHIFFYPRENMFKHKPPDASWCMSLKTCIIYERTLPRSLLRWFRFMVQVNFSQYPLTNRRIYLLSDNASFAFQSGSTFTGNWPSYNTGPKWNLYNFIGCPSRSTDSTGVCLKGTDGRAAQP